MQPYTGKPSNPWMQFTRLSCFVEHYEQIDENGYLKKDDPVINYSLQEKNTNTANCTSHCSTSNKCLKNCWQAAPDSTKKCLVACWQGK